VEIKTSESYESQAQDRLRSNDASFFAGRGPLVLLAAVAVCIFAIRMGAPPNLLDQDQERPAAYVLDVLKNGNWLCQRDWTGDITSKPPLYTWLCTLAALPFGRINLLALYLPGALAGFGIAWMLFELGRATFGGRAALFGALISMLTSAGVKAFGLARTDGVFAFMVTAAALLAFRAWVTGRGWTWFWVMAAAATLTKGPLGLVFSACGLLACLWEKKSGSPLPIRGSYLRGVLLFLLITVGWLLASYWQYGPAVLNKLLSKELVGHAASTAKHIPGTLIYQQPLYYLGRAAPWSLLAYWGLWRIWRRPAIDINARRLERFLFCWFAVGLMFLSLAPHQRADLLWPIMPAGALIAGVQLAQLTRSFPDKAVYRWSAAVIMILLLGFSYYYFGPRAREPIIRQTVAVKKLAAELEQKGGKEFPLTHVDAPIALQVYLNTLRPRVSYERAAQLLRGSAAAFLAINDLKKLELAGSKEDKVQYQVLLSAGNGKTNTYIIGNRSTLEPGNSIACCFGPILIRATDARLLKLTEKEVCFDVITEPAKIMVTNESAQPHKMSVCLFSKGVYKRQQKTLEGHETWTPQM
jgi:4-amino-4-deoxy-L-arabinose transferase-like glycosyltransferase